MIIRSMAALAVLATSAWAQTEPATETMPAATAETAPAEPTSVGPLTETVAQVVPTDPLALAAFALTSAREGGQCRYAFSRLTAGGAQFGWSASAAEVVARFDPRLAVGERWTVVRANSQQRAIQRSLNREDRKGLPSDLIGLMAEGEWTYENIAVVSEHPDKVVYSYTPRAIPERAANETGVRIIEQLVGQFEVSRDTGRLISGALTEPPEGAVRALGIVRVHRALFGFRYATGASGFLLTDSGAQQMRLSALGTPSEVEFSFRFEDVEPICDPAEVARISAAEAAAAARD